jgi:hypothetical protein
LQRVSEDDVMRILVTAAVAHRLSVSPPEDHPRLRQLLDGITA